MRAAIVGAGLMGRWHARELGHAGGVMVGVFDADLAAAERLAGAHRGAKAFENYDLMLAETSPEVVHVCTPPASHVPLAERALRAGAHAIVEKPVAPTAGETERLLGVAESHGKVVCPVHQYLFQRPLRRARHTLEKLGPVLDFSWIACSAGATGRTPEEADAVAADILPHPLSVLQRLHPADFAQLAWCASRPRAGELRAFAAAEGTSVSIVVSMDGRPTRNELRILGAGGALYADLFHGYAIIEPSAVSRTRKITRPFALSAATTRAAAVNLARRALQREPAYPGLRGLFEAIYAFARGDMPPPITHEECLGVARARERILSTAGSCSSWRSGTA
jgi:predicted dehydrogenase